jgi:hypothetical protein
MMPPMTIIVASNGPSARLNGCDTVRRRVTRDVNPIHQEQIGATSVKRISETIPDRRGGDRGAL